MHVFEQGQKKFEMNVFIVNCYLRCTFFWNHFHNIQGEGAYVFEQFLEATLRPWMDSDNNFVDTKNCLGIYHGLRTPNEGINQRYLKKWADVADKICCRHT